MYKSSACNPTVSAVFATHDLKQRVFTCLDRLSDRDTLSRAAAELDSIARTLPPDSLSPFLTCCLAVDSSHKSLVRAHSLRLLSLLASTHGTSLSPHLPKILSSLLRRLRDLDSAVRSACVDAVSSLSRHLTSSPLSAFLDPLLSALLTEQDDNSQTGTALCLSMAIDAVHPEDDAAKADLRKAVPKLLRLLRSESFKAKPALLGVVGSAVGVNGCMVAGRSRAFLGNVVRCVVEFLSSEDWAARKAAAEVLEKVAVTAAEKGLAADVKKLCVCSLEGRRFDKVKVTRETMKRALEAWKKVAAIPENESRQSPSNSSPSKDTTCGGRSPHISKSSHQLSFEARQCRKTVTASRSSLSESDESTMTFSPAISSSPSHVGLELAQSKKATSKSRYSLSPGSMTSRNVVQERCPNKSSNTRLRMPISRDLGEKACDWSTEVYVPLAPSKEDLESRNFQVPAPREARNCGCCVPERSGSLIKKIEESEQKCSHFRLGSHVVSVGEENGSEVAPELDDNNTEIEGMPLMREQLVHIERQQSSLLNLLQSFMGTSQCGISTLEKRVSGLEQALDEISYNLSMQTGRTPNNDYAGNTCCSFPGTEFLSPKFWRKTEGRYPGTPNCILDRDAIDNKLEGHCLSRVSRNSQANVEQLNLIETPKKLYVNGQGVQAHSPVSFDGASLSS